jgi:hypothetical protein
MTFLGRLLLGSRREVESSCSWAAIFERMVELTLKEVFEGQFVLGTRGLRGEVSGGVEEASSEKVVDSRIGLLLIAK